LCVCFVSFLNCPLTSLCRWLWCFNNHGGMQN